MKQECQKCEPEKWAHKENGQTIMLCDEHWNALGTLSTIKEPTPHTHGEHGSHTRLVEKTIRKSFTIEGTFHEVYKDTQTDFLQFICLDDGVIYKELEITREVK